jgi:hypothetical protein
MMPDTRCVLRVGDGRGFIVEHRYRVKLPTGNRFLTQRFVITAAHCLPQLPPAHGASYTEERTYANLLGPLGGKASIWAECWFVDPVGDIAVLGEPDNQNLDQEYDGFCQLVETAPVVPIGRWASTIQISSEVEQSGWMLSLAGQWVEMPLRYFQGMHGTSVSIRESKPGQSGSPILNQRGEAIALVALGSSNNEWSPQPVLCRDLPTRYLPSRFRKEET